jgi:hypothetical protein
MLFPFLIGCFSLIKLSEAAFIDSYGPSFNDSRLPPNDDNCYLTSLQFEYTFFNQRISVIQICTNGYLLLDESRVSVYELDLITRNTGNIFNRTVTDNSTLDSIKNQIRQAFPVHSQFSATQAYMVTWAEVPYFYKTNSLHTFQVVLATNGTNSFIVLNYLRTDQKATYTRILDRLELLNRISFNGNAKESNYDEPGSFVFPLFSRSSK